MQFNRIGTWWNDYSLEEEIGAEGLNWFSVHVCLPVRIVHLTKE